MVALAAGSGFMSLRMSVRVVGPTRGVRLGRAPVAEAWLALEEAGCWRNRSWIAARPVVVGWLSSLTAAEVPSLLSAGGTGKSALRLRGTWAVLAETGGELPASLAACAGFLGAMRGALLGALEEGAAAGARAEAETGASVAAAGTAG